MCIRFRSGAGDDQCEMSAGTTPPCRGSSAVANAYSGLSKPLLCLLFSFPGMIEAVGFLCVLHLVRMGAAVSYEYSCLIASRDQDRIIVRTHGSHGKYRNDAR